MLFTRCKSLAQKQLVALKQKSSKKCIGKTILKKFKSVQSDGLPRRQVLFFVLASSLVHARILNLDIPQRLPSQDNSHLHFLPGDR